MSICNISGCDKRTKDNRKICAMHKSRWTNHRSYDLPIRKIRPKNRRGHDTFMVCLKHGQLSKEQIQFSYSKMEGPIQHCKRCNRESNNRRKFGITEKDYERMILEQKGVCAICKNPEIMTRNGKVLILAIDHCHTAEKRGIMKVRGLLCAKCNHGLGSFRDSPELLTSAICYLLR